MNKNQKTSIAIGIIFIVSTFIYWYSQGSVVFSKTQILVDKTSDLDRMLGVENKEYIDQFVFGLFPSGMTSAMEMISASSLSGMILVITGILIYLLKNKRKETK